MLRVCCKVVVAAAILVNPLIDRFIIRNQQLRQINNSVAVVITFSMVIPEGTFISRGSGHTQKFYLFQGERSYPTGERLSVTTTILSEWMEY